MFERTTKHSARTLGRPPPIVRRRHPAWASRMRLDIPAPLSPPRATATAGHPPGGMETQIHGQTADEQNGFPRSTAVLLCLRVPLSR